MRKLFQSICILMLLTAGCTTLNMVNTTQQTGLDSGSQSSDEMFLKSVLRKTEIGFSGDRRVYDPQPGGPNYQGAVVDFTRIIESSPSPKAYYYRGLTNSELDNDSQALQDFIQSLLPPSEKEDKTTDIVRIFKALPESAIDYYNRGLTRYEIGNILDATQALQLETWASQIHFILGLAYYDVGNHRSARIDHETAGLFSIPFSGVPLLTVNTSYYFDQGRILAQRGDNSRAFKFLQIAATAFRVQGKIERYREAQALLKRLKR